MILGLLVFWVGSLIPTHVTAHTKLQRLLHVTMGPERASKLSTPELDAIQRHIDQHLWVPLEELPDLVSTDGQLQMTRKVSQSVGHDLGQYTGEVVILPRPFKSMMGSNPTKLEGTAFHSSIIFPKKSTPATPPAVLSFGIDSSQGLHLRPETYTTDHLAWKAYRQGISTTPEAASEAAGGVKFSGKIEGQSITPMATDLTPKLVVAATSLVESALEHRARLGALVPYQLGDCNCNVATTIVLNIASALDGKVKLWEPPPSTLFHKNGQSYTTLLGWNAKARESTELERYINHTQKFLLAITGDINTAESKDPVIKAIGQLMAPLKSELKTHHSLLKQLGEGSPELLKKVDSAAETFQKRATSLSSDPELISKTKKELFALLDRAPPQLQALRELSEHLKELDKQPGLLKDWMDKGLASLHSPESKLSNKLSSLLKQSTLVRFGPDGKIASVNIGGGSYVTRRENLETLADWYRWKYQQLQMDGAAGLSKPERLTTTPEKDIQKTLTAELTHHKHKFRHLESRIRRKHPIGKKRTDLTEEQQLAQAQKQRARFEQQLEHEQKLLAWLHAETNPPQKAVMPPPEPAEAQKMLRRELKRIDTELQEKQSEMAASGSLGDILRNRKLRNVAIRQGIQNWEIGSPANTPLLLTQ